MKKLSSIILTLALLVSVLPFGGLRVLALESSDTNAVEVDAEKKIVYVYGRETTVADLKKILGAEIVYTNLAGHAGTDTERVLNGTVTAEDGVYQVAMTKELLRMDFEEDGPAMTFSGYGGRREAGIGGKGADDFAWVVSAPQAPSGNIEWQNVDGAGTGKVTTYEIKVMIPSMYEEGQANNLTHLNFCIKTESDQMWAIQPRLLGNGKAQIPGKTGDIEGVALGAWHSLAVTFRPTEPDAKKAEACFYLDGELTSTLPLTNYIGVASVKIGVQGESGQPAKVAVDDYLVYNGFYGMDGLASLDDRVVEIDGKTVYVYDTALTKAELLAKISANGAALDCIREDSSAVEEGAVIDGGWLTVDGERYPIRMKKELVSVDFNDESQALMGFEGLTSERRGGLAGKTDKDYAQAVSTESGSGASVRTWPNSGSPSRRIITYEMNLLIPERYQEQENAVDKLNFIIKTDSDQPFKLQTQLLGNGEAVIPGRDSNLTDIARDQWHRAALTIKPQADGSAEFYSYLDGVQVGTDRFTEYTGIADIRLEITFPSGKAGMAAFDDYKAYYGAYMSEGVLPVSQDYRIEIAGASVYVYSLTLTKKEFLEKISAPGAVVNYYSEEGQLAAETDLVKNGTLTVDDKSYAVKMKKEIHSDSYNREIPKNTSPSGLQGINKVEGSHRSYVQSGLAGRKKTDTSFVIETQDFAGPEEMRNPSLQVWNTAEGIITVQTAVYLEGKDVSATLAVPCAGTDGTIWAGSIVMDSAGAVKAQEFSAQAEPGEWHVMAITADTRQKTFIYYFDGAELGSKTVDTMTATRNFNVEVTYPTDAAADKTYSGKLAVDSFSVYYGPYDAATDLMTVCPASGEVVLSDQERAIGIGTDYTAAEFKSLFSPASGLTLYDDATMDSQTAVNNFGVWGEGEYALFQSPSGDRIRGYHIVMLGETVKAGKPVITAGSGTVSASVAVTAAGFEGSQAILVLAAYDANGAMAAVTAAEGQVEVRGLLSAVLDIDPAGKTFKAFVLEDLSGIRPLGEPGVYPVQ